MTIRDNFLNAIYSAEKRMDQKLTARIRREAAIVGKPYGRMLEISHDEFEFRALYPYEYQDLILDDEMGPEGGTADPFIRRFLNDIDYDDLDEEFDYFFNDDFDDEFDEFDEDLAS